MSEQTADGHVLTDQGDDSAASDNVRPMDRAKQKVNAAVGEARQKFQHAAADVGERFQQASAVAQERSQQAREAARERYQVTSARMQDGYNRARRDVDFMVEDVNDFVREKPGTSVLIAAGAGFLLGLLFRPRR
ncbi:MAG: hypothetical protein AAF657_28690 [Acidobacteriota bacterium]